MPPIRRPWCRGTIKIDVRLLEAIEELTRIDEAPSPDLIAPIQARADAERDARRDPNLDDALCKAAEDAMDGCWLTLWEAHAVQRLRGWNRARHGMITVDAGWLTAVRNLLDNLTLGLDAECESVLEGYGADRVSLAAVVPDAGYAARFAAERAEVLASMVKTGGCGECDWCTALRLRDEVDGLLDAAGFDGGVYYHAYALNWTQAQLAEHYGWRLSPVSGTAEAA